MVDGVVLAVISLSSFAAGFCYSVAGLGGAVTFIIMWAIAGQLGLAQGGIVAGMPYTIIHACVVTPLVAAILWDKIPWAFCLWTSLIWNVTHIVGFEILFYLDGVVFTRCIGVGVFMVFVLQASIQMAKWKESKAEERPQEEGRELQEETRATRFVLDSESDASSRKETYLSCSSCRQGLAAWILGSAAGLVQGMSGMSFPATLVYVSLTDVPKDEWRAANSTMIALTLPLGAWYFFVVKGGYDHSALPLYIASFTANCVALPIGNRVSSWIDQQAFKDIVLVNLLVGSVFMIFVGTSSLAYYCIAALAVAATMVLVFVRSCLRDPSTDFEPNVVNFP